MLICFPAHCYPLRLWGIPEAEHYQMNAHRSAAAKPFFQKYPQWTVELSSQSVPTASLCVDIYRWPMASNLTAMASNLEGMASNLRAMASNLLAIGPSPSAEAARASSICWKASRVMKPWGPFSRPGSFSGPERRRCRTRAPIAPLDLKTGGGLVPFRWWF